MAQSLWPDFCIDTVTRLKQLRRDCNAANGGIFAPASLIPLFERAALAVITPDRFGIPPRVKAPPDWFDAEASLALAAGMVGDGKVRFCAPVAAKMNTQTIGAAMRFKAGDGVEMALRTAFILSICLEYDPQLKSRPRRAG